jgi:valyl-tRNA synthetase
MELSTRYDPKDIESRWYAHWEDSGYFHSVPDDREAYSIVIPPPNVTGVLHMGHMLNNSVQDILARKARLDGKNVCWVPGTDHASIATEAKVVHMLREQGIKKSDLTRDEFMKYAWEWRDKYGGIILQQLRRLGASCDWERTAFTMDDTRSAAVIKVFVDLYRKGKIYRGHRMVNWDPQAQTVLSNEEVIYGDEDTTLYYVRYALESGDDHITVATTRPETILGDTAIAVNPDDPRFAHMVGKNVVVPLADRVIPIIQDDYVDKEFGTGALKITPAHDQNDYDIGVRHKLEVIDVLNADGTMAEIAGFFVGEDRDVARKKMAAKLEELGSLEKTEIYRHAVGRSERTNVVVEPRLSLQWYVDMKSLAAPATNAVATGEVGFFPEKYQNVFRHWMDNIRDWCISRQLWWGQRIPAYYLGTGDSAEVFVAESREDALAQAREKTGNAQLSMDDLRQEEDVVDTWFSSWLWPVTVFNGFDGNAEFKYYYPTKVLVTGWDIIFLWVARMMMAGYEFIGERPFDHVYFTGMVRDKQRRKMSKQLGNSPDALNLIDTYGADGVRFGILSSSPAGGDLLFDEKLCEQGRNFCNKLWNALRLVKGWEVTPQVDADVAAGNALACQWFDALLAKTNAEINEKFVQYRLSDAMMTLYTFVWDDFCSWFLEMVKPAYGKPLDQKTMDFTVKAYESICILLHPFMPFITEELWHQLGDRKDGEDCMAARSLEQAEVSESELKNMDSLRAIVTGIRELRNQHNVGNSKVLTLYAEAHQEVSDEGNLALLKKLANLEQIVIEGSVPDDAFSFRAGTQLYHLDMPVDRNPEEEREKLNKEADYLRGFIKSVEKKLSNERFVAGAPADVVDKERQKLDDGKVKLAAIEEALGKL